MNKPASVAIKEFSKELENCINESGLPAVIVEIVLRGYYLQIRELAENQTRNDEESYRQESEAADNGK